MGRLHLDQLLLLVRGLEPIVAGLWLGMAAISVTLLVLVRTRWGQSHPLRKCLILSLLAHALLAGYATTIKITFTPPVLGSESVVRVAVVDNGGNEPSAKLAERSGDVDPTRPWDGFGEDPALGVPTTPLPRQSIPTLPEVRRQTGAAAGALPVLAPTQRRALDEAASPQPGLVPVPLSPPLTASVKSPEAIEPAGTIAGGNSPTSDLLPRSLAGPAGESQGESLPRPLVAEDSGKSRGGTVAGIPGIYQLRVAPDRTRQIEKRGATGETEEAVRAALGWLAEQQSASGGWIAADHGAGQERFVNGRDRHGAGAGADTGVTGLALLAFLAAGNTQRQGKYQETVRRGIEYLMGSQAGDGDLAGAASEYAAMYCHAMAALALSEAYGMTGDARLRDPVRSAVAYTLSMQNPTTGGWRYRRGDDGDTSQLGWQLMTLKSAELAGIEIPAIAWRGAERFLRSISYGKYGGLAAYRPGERVSFAMTAEALVCRLFLGLKPDSSAVGEAGDYLLRELPGQSNPANEYYWYYGSLAMYQLQGVRWQRWNEALQRTLLTSQRNDGEMAGSWDTNTLWGGYGGRVYTTAMAALSLEVYYRYLPLLDRSQEGEAGLETARRPGGKRG